MTLDLWILSLVHYEQLLSHCSLQGPMLGALRPTSLKKAHKSQDFRQHLQTRNQAQHSSVAWASSYCQQASEQEDSGSNAPTHSSLTHCLTMLPYVKSTITMTKNGLRCLPGAQWPLASENYIQKGFDVRVAGAGQRCACPKLTGWQFSAICLLLKCFLLLPACRVHDCVLCL